MSARELKFGSDALLYEGIIGTGGIGSGKFFVLNGFHTLGREESRSGHFLEMTDYCKQHIILHYIKVLLGPSFSVIPIGKIGDDDVGRSLFNEMAETGFSTTWVEKIPHSSTLFSFCFSYPDGSGGNLTTDNSASSGVDAAFIERAASEIRKLGSKGIIMAAPEVPLDARERLLELGRENGLFCSASFTTGEIGYLFDHNLMKNIDLMAINIDEASAVAGITTADNDILSVIKKAIHNMRKHNSSIMASVTAGKEGSWCWDGAHLNWFPAIKANAVSTAGAGDAFFAGMITGLALRLSLFEAQQLASLVAGLSVCSPDTINRDIDRHSLNAFLRNSDIKLSETIIKLLEE
jgi:ribokinase